MTNIPVPKWFNVSDLEPAGLYNIGDYGLEYARCYSSPSTGYTKCDVYVRDVNGEHYIGSLYVDSSGSKRFVCARPDVLVYSGYGDPVLVVKGNTTEPFQSVDQLKDADFACTGNY